MDIEALLTVHGEWIEEFYSELERGFDNYTRPADYIERALRIITGSRNTIKHNKEGRKSSSYIPDDGGYVHEYK